MPDRPATSHVTKARRLRRDMTEAEKRLWHKLRDHQLANQHFRRQFPIGPYVADFCCRTAKLIVEVDGGQHADNAQDERRTAFLAAQGYQVLRFWNNEVLSNIDGVIETIGAHLRLRAPPP